MRGTPMADVQRDLQEVLGGAEWKIDPDSFDPARILLSMETTAEALRPRLLAVHRSCQGPRRPPWLGTGATLVKDLDWMLNSWRGLALAPGVDWSNHVQEFSANVVRLESYRDALRRSIKETVPASRVRVLHYSRGRATATARRRPAGPVPIPSSRPARGTLAAAALVIGLVGLLAVGLSGRYGQGSTALTTRAAAPSTPAWPAPTAPRDSRPPAIAPPDAIASLTSPVSPSSPTSNSAPAPDGAAAWSPARTRTWAATAPRPNPAPTLTKSAPQPPHPALPRAVPQPLTPDVTQPPPAVVSLTVDQPTYGSDQVSTTLTVRVSTTGPSPVTVVLTSASSKWRGTLGWNNASVRVLHLAGQSSYVLTVPFSGRDYCGAASGLNYWGTMVTTTPAAPNRSVYVDLPAVC